MSATGEQEESDFVKQLVQHQSLIQAFVVSLMPGFSETEDIVQNTNEVLWAKRASFKPGTNFKAWALTTARFQVMAAQQAIKRNRLVCLDNDALDAIHEEAQSRDPADTKRKLDYLNECVGLLQIRDQELVLHRYWKKSGLETYAKASGRSIQALRTALYRIRASLRKCVQRKALAGKEWSASE